MNKFVPIVLLLLLSGLQVRLWFGRTGVTSMVAVDKQIEQQKRENERLYQRNRVLTYEVLDLQNGYHILEEKARLELGMIRRDEVFYLIDD